jgi:sugar lactone lactonase YvrE
MRTVLASVPLCLLIAACSPSPGPGDGGGDAAEGGASGDAAMQDDGAGADGGDGSVSRCGAMRPDVSNIAGTEGLVIGPDGTIYYSQPNAVGRLRPGQAQEDGWATLPGNTDTVWGLALDVANRRLYAGSPTARAIYAVDLDAASPMGTVYLMNAGQPNGLTIGLDGALWYTDFGGGNVYRVPAMGMRTRVTTSAIANANGLAFGPDGALYVVSYSAGTLLRLEVSGGMETGRRMVASALGNPDGLAFDAMGRIYVTNNGAGTLTRLDADGSNPMRLLGGIRAAASIEFGAGALRCSDIYVASSGALARFEMGDAPGADVPWHR